MTRHATPLFALDLGVLLERTDETTSRSIVALSIALLIEFLENLLGQHLAQLDTPLVKAVDVPDGALGEGQMFVVDDQRTQLSGTNDAADQDGSGGPVAQESLVGDEFFGSAFGPDFLVGLANHESLSLGKVVGGKHLLVKVIGDGVVRLGGEDEVGGDELGALVDELEEGVLSVGAGFTKDNGAYIVDLDSVYLLGLFETYQ